MPRLDARRATLIAAAVACLVYVNSLANLFAGDDILILRDNDRVHSVGAALSAWFLPYWPPPWQGAGLYRPLTILSYGLDWSLGGGRFWVFHLTNIVFHALATGMVVRIALAWLPPVGALVAGLVFAVHPVHVEAVSNVVGRAELFAATGIFGAVLAARRYRREERDGRAAAWLAATMALVGLALLSKEHAIIAIAVIAVDQVLDPVRPRRAVLPLYLGVVVVTLAWFHLWRSIAGLYIAGGATTAFYGMSTAERWATILPVQLDVLRLLAWPADITSDYSPQTVPLRTSWSVVAAIGLASMAALLALGLASARKAPAIAFGILIALGSYAPTSNFLFVSGVVLAERALYLAVLAPALALGWIVARSQGKEHQRAIIAMVVLLLTAGAVRTWVRTPYWKTMQTAIIEDAGDHPENYRNRIHLAGLLAAKGDTARALAEYLAADALAERDPFMTLFIVNTSIRMKRSNLAVKQGQRARILAPREPRVTEWLVKALIADGQPDAAVATALAGVVDNPVSSDWSEILAGALEKTGAPRPRRLLARAQADWLTGKAIQASAGLDSLEADLGKNRSGTVVPCLEWKAAELVLSRLRPSLLSPPGNRPCQGMETGPKAMKNSD